MGSTENDVWSLELRLLNAETRNRPEQASALLAEDFVEFGRSGEVYRKPETIAALADEQAPVGWRLEVTDGAVALLASHIAHLTYRTARRFASGELDRTTLRSSIWRFSDGSWRMVFHQGTPVA